MLRNLPMFLILILAAAGASAQTPCLDTNPPGAVKKQIRVDQIKMGEGALTVVTKDSKGHNFKISDTLCFSKEKLQRLEAARQTKEPITIVVKDNQIADIL